MAKVARSLVDVVLGEAVSGTPVQRYEDMKAIASAVANRAARAGVSIKDVISAKGQFDAYGKSLPPGVEAFRALAERAIAEVAQFGPTHAGTFYATPKAVDNLPSGLQPVAQTTGHVYFDDPQNRAIATAQGYITPSKAAVSTPELGYFSGMSQPLSKAVETVNGLFSRLSPPAEQLAPAASPRNQPVGTLSYDLSNARRSEVPSSGIGQKVHEVANSVLPGIDTSLFSGMEPKGMAAVGAPNRHPLGFAGDFSFSYAGQPVTDPMALHDIAMGMAAKYGANVGYSHVPNDYMGPGRMHIDTMPLDKFAGGAQWGRTAKSWADNLDFARATGIGPTPYSNAPTPSSRSAAVAEIADAAKEAASRSQLGQSLAQAGVASLSGKQASPARPDNFSAPGQLVGQKAGSLGNLGGMTAYAATPSVDPYADMESRRANAFSAMPATPIASINPTSIAQTPTISAPSVASISPAAISASAVAPTSIAPSLAPTVVSPVKFTPTVAPMVTPVPTRVAPVPPTVAVAPRAPTSSASVRPSPAPAATAADVYAGRATTGVASNGATVSRDPVTGNISVTNQFGATTVTDPSGRQMGNLSGLGKGIGNAFDKAMDHVTPGMIGSVVGGAIAGMPGAIVGGLVGNKMGGQQSGQKSGGLGGLGGFLSGLFGGGNSSNGGGGSSSGRGGGSSGSRGGPAGADRDHAGNG